MSHPSVRAANQNTSLAPMLSDKEAFGADELFRLDDESGAVVAQLSVGGA